jgi:DNA-binding response OmpR family regulator
LKGCSMPVKILLADKSITIQKVVEMLFSGRDYEVVCVSDGETALNEAKRVVPDVVLVDVDLPRIDGYSFAARMKQTPQLAQAPVILMMSRDDVYDGAKGKQSGIIDNIAKPFESQDLIGKVKKAIAAVPPRRAEAAFSAVYEPAAPAPPAVPAKPQKAAPPDIFDIISEAPTQADLVRAAAPVEDESVYEVEPVVEEVEEPLARDAAKALPVGAKAVEEMRAGLGLIGEKDELQPEIITIESLEKAMEAEHLAAFTPKIPSPSPQHPVPSSVQASTLPEAELRMMAETTIAKMAKDMFANLPPIQPPQMSDETLRAMIEEKVSVMTKEALDKMPVPQTPTLTASEVWGIAEETVAKMAKDMFANLPPVQPPQMSDETLRAMIEEKVSSMAKEVLEMAPAAQPPALSASEMWSVAEEAVEKIAKEFLQKQQLTQAPKPSDETLKDMVEKVAVKTVEEMFEKRPVQQPPSVPASELRQIAEETVSRMAREVFKDIPPPTPKISEETVRRGIEEAVMQIAREVAREVIEKVAWEVIPQLAEVMINEEIERLKAET